MRHALVITAAILSSLYAAPVMASAPAIASERAPIIQTGNEVQQVAQRQITAREARAIALARVPGGEVVDIRRTRDTYRVRIIARDGRVVDIVVDANTGRIR